MRRSAAAVFSAALITFNFATVPVGFAQDAAAPEAVVPPSTTPPVTPPSPTATPPAAPAPSATPSVTPAAPATSTPPTVPPAASPDPASGAPASDATDPALDPTVQPDGQPGTTLPEVEVIQTAPTPPEPEPEVAAPKPVKKRPPTPQPAVAASPPQPRPQQAPQPDPEPAPVALAPQDNPPAPEPFDFGAPENLSATAVPTSAGPLSGNTPVRMSPLGGSEIPLEKVPTSVGAATAQDISQDGSKQLQNVLQQQVPGVIVTDIGGSGFRTDVSYRGFDASPVGGRAQGLAVYQNGVRINEAFGDNVNLDIIPSNAIQDISVISGNPVFGLNAIGGAISIVTKDGFSYEGGEIDTMFGSFGRRQVGVQAGGNSGGVSVYAAGEYIEEDGFRDFSDAEVKRMFADLGFKGDNSEFHLSLTAGDSSAGVVTAAPIELLRRDWGRTFTSPQVTDVEVFMPTLSGRIDATETLSFSGVGYYRRLKQRVLDGNLSEADECSFDDALLCLTEDGVEEPLETAAGDLVFAPDGPAGSLERINTDADSYGTVLQAVEKRRLFGRPNQFVVGVSYDHGSVSYNTSSEVGEIGPRFVVTGTGQIVVEPDDLAPRNLNTENDYYGIYFSNALDVTDALTVTVGGRYNYAKIKLEDLTGDFPELNVTNDYDRFNPMVGATYKLMPGLTFYGSYSEANRAPTAAELGCAEPENPCLIESFLTDDPPLNQVVSKSVEVGLRGEHKTWSNERYSWSLGYFRTLNVDDILNVAATATGRGYFLNAGDTLREGFEASLGYENGRLKMYAAYSYLDATFRDQLVLPAPNTPGATTCPDTDPDEDINCNFITPGDTLPGIPKHRFKAGFDYWLTQKWKFGADLVATDGQFFFGDEANNNPKLSGYTRVDLHTSYDVTDNIQIYGLMKNAFDRRYGLYGTFFDAGEANEVSDGSGVTFDEDENRSITPSLPFAVYGGVKIKF